MKNNNFNSILGAVILILHSAIPILMGGFAVLVGLSAGAAGPGLLFVAVGALFVLTGIQGISRSVEAVRELLHTQSDAPRQEGQPPLPGSDSLQSGEQSAGAEQRLPDETAPESGDGGRAAPFSYCPYCGAPTNGKDSFCRFCGRRFPS